MERVFTALKHKDVSIRETAMQVLVEIGKQEYEHVQHYFHKIGEVTATAA